jgi:tRNA uridine 5-carboxymethylaminomethyl modification enzyme
VSIARDTSVSPACVEALLSKTGSAPLAHAIRASELIKRNGVSLDDVFLACGVETLQDGEVRATVELELKYAGYFARERASAQRIQAMGAFALPENAGYADMRSLSTEARHKLAVRKPVTLAQAAMIPGVSPSDIQNLVLEIERARTPATGTAGR